MDAETSKPVAPGQANELDRGSGEPQPAGGAKPAGADTKVDDELRRPPDDRSPLTPS